MGLLEGKVVLVTGAGRGIGRATALAAAHESARVLVNDLGCDMAGRGCDESVAEAVAEEIRRGGGDAVASSLDVSSFESARELVKQAADRWGRLDGVVANAGLGHTGRIERAPESELSRALEVSIHGPYGLLRAAASEMGPHGGGSIVLTAGAEGLFGVGRRTLDATTAGAIIGLGRAAAVELWRQGVRVNVIAPTAATRITNESKLFGGLAADSMQAEDVAPATVFLLSDLSTDVHGEVLGVAGERVYGIESREAVGAFSADKHLSAEQIAARWQEVIGS